MTEAKTYRLTVQRTDRYINHVYVTGTSPEDAVERFQHQLESEECTSIEDKEAWGEAYFYQVVKASPYSAEYDVIEAEIEED